MNADRMSEEAVATSADSRSKQGMINVSKRKVRKSSDARKRENRVKSSKAQHEQIDESGAKELKENDMVVLKVGDQTVCVKKETLVASSEYFKAKFAGHFGDSDAKELDLSRDVDDIDSLKMFLDFLDNSTINITEDSVFNILKVSSFFLVDGLTDYCAEFMSETACLANCVQYYIAAVNFALPERFTRKFDSLVRARFHDLIIFEDSVAEYINDEEFRQLCSTEVLKHCSKESLFDFLLKWLSKSPELTVNQYKVASDVIQFFEKCTSTQTIPFQCDKKKMIANMNRMTDTIRKSRDQELLQNFQQLFTNFLRNKESVLLHTNFHSGDTCVGIFTISKRVSVNRSRVECRNSSKRSFYMPSQSTNELFDICVYQPDSRVWFHVNTFQEDQYFSQVDGRPYNPNIQLRKKFPVKIFCDIEATGNEVLLYDISNRSKLLMLDFMDYESKNWTDFNIKDNITGCEAHQTVRGKNGITYFVTRNVTHDGNIHIGLPNKAEFRGYTFDSQHSDKAVCNLVFSTKPFSVQHRYTQSMWCEMKVNYSSVSNEMLIISSKGVGDDIAMIVDLEKRGKPKSYCLLHREAKCFKDNTESLFADAGILEIDDSFLILSSANNLLTVKFRYTFRSKVLTKVEDGWQYALIVVCDLQQEKWHRLLFGDSCWQFHEEDDHVNKMSRVRFNNSGAVEDEEHTPPPFVRPVAVCVTEVRKSLFCDLEPIRHFLEAPNKNTTYN